MSINPFDPAYFDITNVAKRISDAIVIIDDSKKTIKHANKGFCDLLGYDESELLTHALAAFCEGEGGENVSTVIEGALTNENDQTLVRCKQHDGGVCLVYFSATRCSSCAQGCIIIVIREAASYREIADHIKSLAKFPEENPNPIMRLSREGDIIYANSASTMLRKTYEEEYDRYGRLWKEAIDAAFTENEAIEIEMRTGDTTYTLYFSSVKEMDYVNIYAADTTEKQRHSARVAQSEQRFNDIITNTGDWVWEIDTEGVYTFVSPVVTESTGYRADEMLGKHFAFFFKNEDRYTLLDAVEPLLAERVPFQNLLAVMTAKDGTRITLSISGVPFHGEKNEFLGYRGVCRDITEQEQQAERLRLAGKVFENGSEGIMITEPNGCIIEVNKAFVEITGYSRDEVVGQTPSVLKSGKHDAAFYKEMWKTLAEKGEWQGEIWDRRKGGEIYPKWLSISGVKNNEGTLTHYVSLFADITTIKKNEAQLNYLAHYDTLTELPNRILIADRLTQAMMRANEQDEHVALIMLDLDNFKMINDTLGHRSGDIILVDVADRLRTCITEHDTVGRLGGDEFLAIIPFKGENAIVANIAETILNAFKRPFLLDSRQEVYISTSLGIAVFPFDADNTESFFANVETAMYAAKQEGQNMYHFFSEEMNVAAMRRLAFEQKLRKSLLRDDFLLHYQPRICIETGKVCGMEALIRWQPEGEGMISPGVFIPVAEETGIIIALGKWILFEACTFAKGLHKQGIYLPVAVNISAKQFIQEDIVTTIAHTLYETGLPATYLEIEITETAIVQDVSRTVKTLTQLKELGVSLAVDDFGTGYSSLNYLKQFPLDFLKIDKSFIDGVTTHQNDAAIALTIVSLGHNLSLNVIAEGVETEEQFRFLKENNCDQIQGYYFSKPLSPDALISYTREQGVAFLKP